MAMISELKQLFGEGIAAVTRAVDAVAARFVRSRRILLDESDDGTFTARSPAAPVGRGTFAGAAATMRCCGAGDRLATTFEVGSIIALRRI